MYFVHGLSQRDDTIVALSTPPGVGGIAVIRISGKEAIELASKLCCKDIQFQGSHTVRLRNVYSSDGLVIDKALIIIMKSPRSFTGEDIVEVQCHGGHFLTKKIISTLTQYGARPADPGEFSLRAFLNHKIDLTQAESIQDIIGATSEVALKVSENQLEGKLSSCIRDFQKRGTHIAAILEAWVDFPEEDLEFVSFDEIIKDLSLLQSDIERLIETYHEGRILREGVSICFIGAPNVGKSSLMNTLLGKERAIVSPIAGTTRDLVEDDAVLNGIAIRLVDTAGIRETDDMIESEGIKRSKSAIERVDIVIVVLDASAANEDTTALAIIDTVPLKKSIIVWNKIDMLEQKTLWQSSQKTYNLPIIEHDRVVYTSARTSFGIDEIKKAIDSLLWTKPILSRDEIMITNVRHKYALELSLTHLKKVIIGLQEEHSPEFIVLDIKQFLFRLGSVIGTDVDEDILTSIFSQFCIGK